MCEGPFLLGPDRPPKRMRRDEKILSATMYVHPHPVKESAGFWERLGSGPHRTGTPASPRPRFSMGRSFCRNDARSVPWPTPKGALAWPDFRSMLPRKFHWSSCSPHCILPGVMWLTSGTLRQMYDCYVIGSGPAGITLALELAKANKKVLLFESGTAIDARADMPNAINYGHLRDGWWDKHSIRTLGGTSKGLDRLVCHAERAGFR